MSLSQYNYDLNAISLVKGTGSPPEMYIPLWWYSGSYASLPGNASPFSQYLKRGSTSTSASAVALHTLSSNWNPNNKYAFEATIWSSTSGQTVVAELYDITLNTAISSTQISTTSTTPTVIRSGQVTLTPGHSYAVYFWSTASTVTAYITDASLIVFPS